MALLDAHQRTNALTVIPPHSSPVPRTPQIPASERRGIPHHLIDILDVTDEFSAGRFYELAQEKIAEIHARGKVPVVAGGTGFYLKWLMEGRPATPAATPEVAAAAGARVDAARAAAREAHRAATGDPSAEPSEEALWEACCALVASLGDEESADMLRRERNNEYRLRRVVEILLASGKPRSEMLGRGGAGLVCRDVKVGPPRPAGAAPGANDEAGASGAKLCESGKGDAQDRDDVAAAEKDTAQADPPPTLCTAFYLTRPRMELYRRIDERVEDMAVSGLFAEAAWLLEQGVAPNSNCATKAIGYRQAIDAILSLARDPDVVLEDVARPASLPPAPAPPSPRSAAAKEASSATSSQPEPAKKKQKVKKPPPPPRHPLAPAALEAVTGVQTASRRFCHRQTSWFRGDANFRWLDASEGTEAAVERVLACVEAAREGSEGPVPKGPPPEEPRTKEQEREFKRYQAEQKRLLPGSEDEYVAANLLVDAARRVRALIRKGALAEAGGAKE